MSNRFFQRLMLVLLVLILLPGSIYAETATDDIDVYSGLAPVMTLTCTDLNFGVYQIARGDRGTGGVTTVTLSWNHDGFNDVYATSIGFTNPGQDMIALSDKLSYDGPSPGLCTVSGSQASNTSIAISRSPTTAFNFAGTAGNPFAATLDTPDAALTNMLGVMTVPATVALDANGSGSFVITGAVQIPNNLSAGNYGSYKGPAVTISVSDGL